MARRKAKGGEERRSARADATRAQARSGTKARASSAAGVGEAAVLRATGRAWSEWFAILERAGARRMEHPAIARRLAELHPELGGWWTQMVTVAYEREHLGRQKHEKPDGFEVGLSRTLPVALASLWAAWADERERKRWLGRRAHEVTKATPGRSMRMRLADGTRVSATFWKKGAAKCQVQVQHARLRDARAAERAKAFWSKALDRMATRLER